jgi:hypothetical protein
MCKIYMHVGRFLGQYIWLPSLVNIAAMCTWTMSTNSSRPSLHHSRPSRSVGHITTACELSFMLLSYTRDLDPSRSALLLSMEILNLIPPHVMRLAASLTKPCVKEATKSYLKYSSLLVKSAMAS